MKSRIKRLERLFAIRNGLVWHQTPYYVMYLFIVMVCLFSWTCIFMMDSRAWDESESRDQYFHLLHTLTIGVTRTRKIAASLSKTVTYVEDWLNTNRLLRTFNNRFVLPNLLTCYMNQVRHCLVYRALVISVKDTLYFIVRNRYTVYKCKLGTAFGLINNFVIFSEMVVGTKNK